MATNELVAILFVVVMTRVSTGASVVDVCEESESVITEHESGGKQFQKGLQDFDT
jgi:hypothetical protein